MPLGDVERFFRHWKHYRIFGTGRDGDSEAGPELGKHISQQQEELLSITSQGNIESMDKDCKWTNCTSFEGGLFSKQCYTAMEWAAFQGHYWSHWKSLSGHSLGPSGSGDFLYLQARQSLSPQTLQRYHSGTIHARLADCSMQATSRFLVRSRSLNQRQVTAEKSLGNSNCHPCAVSVFPPPSACWLLTCPSVL